MLRPAQPRPVSEYAGGFARTADLSQLKTPPKPFLPTDKEEGFDNLGETLKMSDFLPRQYLKVARAAVDRATFPDDRPEAETYRPGRHERAALNL